MNDKQKNALVVIGVLLPICWLGMTDSGIDYAERKIGPSLNKMDERTMGWTKRNEDGSYSPLSGYNREQQAYHNERAMQRTQAAGVQWKGSQGQASAIDQYDWRTR